MRAVSQDGGASPCDGNSKRQLSGKHRVLHVSRAHRTLQQVIDMDGDDGIIDSGVASKSWVVARLARIVGGGNLEDRFNCTITHTNTERERQTHTHPV